MAKRPFIIRIGWTLRDYAKRVWDNAGEDSVFFLAGGIAFNLILAALPFVLLLGTGLTYLLPMFVPGDVDSTQKVFDFIDRLLPAHAHVNETSPYHTLINDLLRTRRAVTIFSAIGFVWFSTRLFGSLRTVLADVFDIESERGIIAGKIFDVKITVVSTLLFVASVTVTSYVSLATSEAAVRLGLRKDVIGSVDYWLGRGLGFLFIALMFFALYKFLPIRRVRTKTAWVAATFCGLSFELARTLFTLYTTTFNPASLYTGTVTAIIVIIVWFYYASLIFILGGEVGQVFELRRTRRLQREVFTD